jgi:hypothetical protein
MRLAAEAPTNTVGVFVGEYEKGVKSRVWNCPKAAYFLGNTQTEESGLPARSCQPTKW